MWIVHVDLGGKPDGRFFLGNPTSEVTVGRPPAKAATETPDVVVHEKSVSKVHALLVLAADGSRLIFHDKSRYGTTINGVKHQGGSVPLSDGDRAQLAPKAFLTFQEQQLVVCVPEGHGAMADMQRAAHTVGARLTHVYDSSVTHVVAGDGACVWSGVVMAALYGKPLVQETWLGELTLKRAWAEQLPAGAPASRLVVPCSPPLEVEVTADPAAGGRLAALQRGTLAGLAFAPGSQWRDAGLPVCIVALGGKVVPPSELGQVGAPRGPVALVLEEGEEETAEQAAACNGGWAMVVRVPELLACMMRSDASALRQQLEALEGARAGAGAAAAAAGGAAAGVAAEEGGEDVIEDSDLTEMADDEEGPGEEVQQAPAPGGQHEQRHDRAAAAPGSEAGDRGRPAARPAGPGGWFSGAHQGANGSAPAAGAAPGPHPDAPEPKRRRINSGAAQPAPAVPLTSAAGPSAAPSAAPEPDASQAAIREQRARAQARTALAAAAAAAAAEHGVELPWLSTQHPASSPPAAARRGGAAAASTPPTHTAGPDPDTKPQRGTLPGLLQPKQEPGSVGRATGPAGATGTRRAGGAKGKKAAAAVQDAALDGLPPVRGSVKKEEEAETGTPAAALNASAQVVVEVSLVAGGGSNGGSSAAADGVGHPRWPALSDEDPGAPGGGGGSQDCGNFKRFRKQGQQLPPSQVEPLGVVPVEAFREDEQTAEFLRQEQERAARKRRADDMFRSANAGAGAGGKRPPRAPKRG